MNIPAKKFPEWIIKSHYNIWCTMRKKVIALTNPNIPSLSKISKFTFHIMDMFISFTGISSLFMPHQIVFIIARRTVTTEISVTFFYEKTFNLFFTAKFKIEYRFYVIYKFKFKFFRCLWCDFGLKPNWLLNLNIYYLVDTHVTPAQLRLIPKIVMEWR